MVADSVEVGMTVAFPKGTMGVAVVGLVVALDAVALVAVAEVSETGMTGRCMMPFATTVANLAKCLSNQPKANRFIVASVLKTKVVEQIVEIGVDDGIADPAMVEAVIVTAKAVVKP